MAEEDWKQKYLDERRAFEEFRVTSQDLEKHLDEELDQKIEQVEELKEKLKALEDENQRLQSKRRKEMDSYNSKIDNLSHTIESLREQLDEQRKDKQRLEVEMDRLERTEKKYSMQAKRLQEEAERAQEEVIMLQSDLLELRQSKRALECQVTHLQKEVDDSRREHVHPPSNGIKESHPPAAPHSKGADRVAELEQQISQMKMKHSRDTKELMNTIRTVLATMRKSDDNWAFVEQTLMQQRQRVTA